jgi:hypothetical protein
LTPWFKPPIDPTETREFFEALSQDKNKIPTSSIVEATGKVPRVITNPPVVLKEPFNFDRPDGRYSLVEKKTLRELGKGEGLKGWKIEGERKGWVSARMKRLDAERKAEEERLGRKIGSE